MNSYTTRVHPNALAQTLNWTREQIAKTPLSSSKKFHFELAAEEAIVNVFTHAKAKHSVELLLVFEGTTLQVKDNADPFDPLNLEIEIDADRPLQERTEGGLGVHFLKESVDHLEYRREGNHNILTLQMKDD